MDGRQLRDSDWAVLRASVPAFEGRWREITAKSDYDETLPFVNLDIMARFVARELLGNSPDDLLVIGQTLEAMYTEAAIRDDESLTGLLTVGFLENILLEADRIGLPLTRIEPMLSGWRTREEWYKAVAYLKPDFHWEDGVGAVPCWPLPTPVGTVEIHRGWSDRANGLLRLDARLLAGQLEAGYLLRKLVSKDSYVTWMISAATLRSPDVPDEYHIEIIVPGDHSYEMFEREMSFLNFRGRFREIARPAPESPLA
jgi:hypothetical protein